MLFRSPAGHNRAALTAWYRVNLSRVSTNLLHAWVTFTEGLSVCVCVCVCAHAPTCVAACVPIQKPQANREAVSSLLTAHPFVWRVHSLSCCVVRMMAFHVRVCVCCVHCSDHAQTSLLETKRCERTGMLITV